MMCTTGWVIRQRPRQLAEPTTSLAATAWVHPTQDQRLSARIAHCFHAVRACMQSMCNDAMGSQRQFSSNAKNLIVVHHLLNADGHNSRQGHFSALPAPSEASPSKRSKHVQGKAANLVSAACIIYLCRSATPASSGDHFKAAPTSTSGLKSMHASRNIRSALLLLFGHPPRRALQRRV